MSDELSPLLHDAQATVDELLIKLRAQADSARGRIEGLATQLRYAERQLDEVTLRSQNAAQVATPIRQELFARHAELRTRAETLQQELRHVQHVVKQLDQLVRQIEMSSSTLTGGEESSGDPWMLALRAQVIHGREEERQRLAREVHDGPAQVLANSLMMLETCYSLAQQTGNDRLMLMLDRLRSASREGLGDVRRFIADLRPAKLDEQGVAGAIVELVQRYISAYGAKVSVEIDDRLPRLPHEVEIVLYRVVQEALQNAYKYARHAPVIVKLMRQGSTLRLSIRDEGPGFEPREVARRAGRTNWGLTSMRERAELVGAKFNVSSRPGHGTEVQVLLPLLSR